MATPTAKASSPSRTSLANSANVTLTRSDTTGAHGPMSVFW